MNIQHGIHKNKPLRECQEIAYAFVSSSNKKFIGINAPTGSGKSIIGFDSISSPFFYLCSSIHLEHQLQYDFPEASLLKGKGNYPCDIFETADLCIMNPNKCALSCSYLGAKMAALNNPYSILNFHYFLYAANFAGFARKTRNIIVDEADSLDDILTGFISFAFSMRQLKYLRLAFKPPFKKTVIGSFVSWMKLLAVKTRRELTGIKGYVEDIDGNKYVSQEELKLIKKHKQLANIDRKIRFLESQDLTDSNWVYYSNDNTVVVKPKWLNRDLADKFLFNYGNKFLFMSATLPPKPVFCGLYGLKMSEVDYLELPHPFDKENRKIVYRPRFSLTAKEMEG